MSGHYRVKKPSRHCAFAALILGLSSIFLTPACQPLGDGWVEQTCAKKGAPKGSSDYESCKRHEQSKHRRLLYQFGGGGP